MKKVLLKTVLAGSVVLAGCTTTSPPTEAEKDFSLSDERELPVGTMLTYTDGQYNVTIAVERDRLVFTDSMGCTRVKGGRHDFIAPPQSWKTCYGYTGTSLVRERSTEDALRIGLDFKYSRPRDGARWYSVTDVEKVETPLGEFQTLRVTARDHKQWAWNLGSYQGYTIPIKFKSYLGSRHARSVVLSQATIPGGAAAAD